MPLTFTEEDFAEKPTFSEADFEPIEEATQPEAKEPEISPDIIARGLGPSPITASDDMMASLLRGQRGPKIRAALAAEQLSPEAQLTPGEILSKTMRAVAIPAAAAARTLRDVLSPMTYLPEAEKPRRGVIVTDEQGRQELRYETEQEKQARESAEEPIQPGKGLIGSPTGPDASRLLNRWTTPEGLLMLPAGMTRAGAMLLLSSLPETFVQQISDVIKGKGSDEQKRDTVNDLFANAALITKGLSKGKVNERIKDAIQRETEKVLQPVREQPIEGPREVPAAAPSEEIGRGGEPPAQEAAARPAEPEVLLTPEPKPTVTETTPPVPPEEMPTTPTVTGLRPAIRLVGGKVAVGDAGMTHPEIIARDKLKAEDIDQRGFVDEQGRFQDREQAAAQSGVPTERESGRQHSTDLPEAKAVEQPKEPVTPSPAPATTQAVSGESAPGVEPGKIEKLPRVGEPFARIGDYEFAIIKGHIPERPDMYGVGVRRVGSTIPFESGGYGSNIKKDAVLERWAEKEVASGSRDQEQEFKHPAAEASWNSEIERQNKLAAEKEAREQAEREAYGAKEKAWNEYKSAVDAIPLPVGKKITITAPSKDGGSLTISGTAYGDYLISKNPSKYSKSPYDVTHIPSGFRMSGDGFSTQTQAKQYIKALIESKIPTKWTKREDLTESDLNKYREVGKAWLAGGDVPSHFKSTAEGQLRTLTEKLESGAKLTPAEQKRYLALRQEATGAKPEVKPEVEAGQIEQRPGPGAMTAGEQPPSAIQQLADRLRATPPVGEKETVALRDKVSDKWAEGKTLTQRALGKLASLSQSLKDTARGVRAITDLDRRVAGLDWELQQSIGRSQQASQAMAKQMKDANQRRAVAIYMDTPGGEAAIRAAIPTLPANTPKQIRKAVETAANLTPEMKQFAEDLRSFFGMREQDAKANEIFEHGLEDYFTHVWRKEANMPDSVRAAISNGRVNDYFQFARKRTIGQLLEGIAAGKVPELDPAKVIPHYNYVLDRAIASRMFIKDLSELDMPDGRPAVLPTGVAIPVERGGTPEALIIDPKRKQQLGTDYRLIDHPALRKWKWAGTDENGNPVLYRSDLSVHPDAYERLARIMDRGRLTPTEWGRSALRVSTEVKGFKLGLLSAFHQVHVGSHALFHWTLPFNLRNRPWLNTDGSINYDHPFVRFAVEKGHLKIAPDPGEIMAMSEGLASPGLLHKIPIVGPWSKAYSEWTFGRYIPKLKVAIMENAYNRALWMRDKLGAYKGLSEDQIAARIGDSVNNALGELNNLFLGKVGRDPRFQRLLRGIFLAPDFGEARLRFAEKALTRYGHEERIALATMFATLYLGARIGNWLSHGDPELDKKRMFQVKIGNHWWSMRSVLGDLHHAITDFGQFMYVRLNPLYARTASDWLFGRDPQGRKISLFDKAIKRPLEQLVPIQLGALTRDDQGIWESFVTAMGVQTRKDRPEQDIGDLARTWIKSSKDPKLEEKLAVLEQEVFPPSRYAPLKNALRFNDETNARKALAKLRITHSTEQIDRAMKAQRPFTGSLADEKKFMATLSPKQRLLYRRAVQERQELYRRFRRLLATPTPRG